MRARLGWRTSPDSTSTKILQQVATFFAGQGARTMPLSGMLLWDKKVGHPVRTDYSDKFAEQVVQVLGPGVAARMAAMHASDGKRVKVESGTPDA